jgi:hypothetical protein
MPDPHTKLRTQYFEITEVVRAVIAQDQVFAKNVWWYSVGLINDSLEIHWKSYVNYSSDHAQTFCGDGRNTEAKCQPKAGVAPPCPEQEGEMCEFRQHLLKLEAATMAKGAHSLGMVSLLHWEQNGESPYVSGHDTGYEWVTAREVIVKSLNPLMPEADNTEYSLFVDKCTKSTCENGHCSVALIPLVQHRFSGDLAYVGAVVICGTKEASDLARVQQSHWQKLSLLKALVTPLLESARGLTGVPTLRGKMRPHDLFYEVLLADLRKDENLFQGDCPDDGSCEVHDCENPPREGRTRHNRDCRLERRNRLFSDDKQIFCEKNARLAKSLFSLGDIVPSKDPASAKGCFTLGDANSLKDKKPEEKYYFSLGDLANFFIQAFEIGTKIESDDKALVEWPFRPGILTAVGLAQLWKRLNEEAEKENETTQLKISVESSQFSSKIRFRFSLLCSKVDLLRKSLNGDDGSTGQCKALLENLKMGLPTRELRPPNSEVQPIIDALRAPSRKVGGILSYGIADNTPSELEVYWDFNPIKTTI